MYCIYEHRGRSPHSANTLDEYFAMNIFQSNQLTLDDFRKIANSAPIDL